MITIINAKSTAKKFALSFSTGLAALGLVIIPVASAAALTVTESNPQGWLKTEASISSGPVGTIKYVATSGALGTGALEFSTPDSNSFARLRKKDINIDLNSVNNMSYMTKQIIAQPNAAVNLRLYIDTTGDGLFDDVLVYEPYYNGQVSSGWQSWTISQSSGFWWSLYEQTYNGKVSTGAGSYENNFMLSDVVVEKPDTKIVELGLGTGTDNSPWTVQADALRVNDTTYNFENTQIKAQAKQKEQCKDEGWKSVVTSTNVNFKNQGSCVSYVNTKS